ncbi:MAG: hypothetical protein QM677_03360, partial [Microbacterium sp.]
ADIDAGVTIANTATATGTGPDGSDMTSDESAVQVTVDQSAALTVVKSADVDTVDADGDVITYSFTVTNTGTVTLTDVALTDPLTGGAVTLTGWSGDEGILAPGESATGTATYTTTQADVDAGAVVNVATATGVTPDDESVTAADPATVQVSSTPAITVEKTGVLDGDAVAGGTVTYSFTVTNTGNVTLTDVSLTDALTGGAVALAGWSGGEGILAPGESVTGAATYTLTQADVDAGSVANSATASGVSSGGVPVEGAGETTTELAADPSIDVVKTGSLDGDAAVGGSVTYSFTVTNTGNVTLSDVVISDPLLGGALVVADDAWPGEVGVLAPGESVATAAGYTLTQADVDAGSVVNTASASGVSSGGVSVAGESVTDTDEVTVSVAPDPAVELVKVGSVGGSGAVGDVVTYTFTATNVGNVTLSDVEIVDLLPGLSDLSYVWPDEGVLAPGESVVATATLVLTEAHLTAGEVVNTATVTGVSSGGDVVEGSDSVTVVTGELPSTGGVFGYALPVGALLAMLIGAGLFLAAARRRENA